MKYFLFAICILFAVTKSADAQSRAKLKKGIVSVGNQSILKYDCDNPWSRNCLYSNLQDEKIMVVKAYFWKKEYTSAGVFDKHYREVEFWDTDLKMYSTETIDALLFKMHKYDVFNTDGSLNKEKAEEFIKINGVDKPNVSFVD